ncbi:Transmembrane protein 120 [Amphibalanus amphitrite]|uniref:Transmembrane protein 120 n=1 Tax=Amphibalanus amphitrite TaxID=1232801 RepID=A0A6A4VB93_AMPAM|nr:transmembrane protein 120 homolog [Amphibalanus amphitrite]XP_043226031.1 transmembrane protein 120 homolog [Amphibalanus amphitrite]XP_043226751.1 transmembrane protein 120 homolog [Amphibalanus amphitrite]XP_043226752.1 transmembrane protein 120 homolog [Amphibalanus amphitrite]KAF0287612.1 Transmembrane protein 120 [Amphibalanus amphitrite]KAF0287613.1 Transmembrane protein 120 [Amphibalanus amphitrite]
MEHGTVEECLEEWDSLTEEYKALEAVHKEYLDRLQEVNKLQAKCLKNINHQRYRLGIINKSTKRFSSSANDPEVQIKAQDLSKDLIRRKAQLYQMENFLPRENDVYLKVILGSVNVSILNKNDRFKYKDEYEKFKLVLNAISMAIAVTSLFFQNRILDLVFMFMLVWYYCTLTIRESILRVNGSRIKGWYRAHHFISCVLSGILLVWPVGEVYHMFRMQFNIFNVYISSVQYLQFMYQRGCLYRLKALGERRDMDITIEGFHSWMWKGLTFLLPFLYVGYVFEFYNAYALYQLSLHPEATWQVWALSVLFLVLAVGNTITTSLVIRQKIKEDWKLKYRFTRLDKHVWTHKSRSRAVSLSAADAGDRGRTKDQLGSRDSAESLASTQSEEGPSETAKKDD